MATATRDVTADLLGVSKKIPTAVVAKGSTVPKKAVPKSATGKAATAPPPAMGKKAVAPVSRGVVVKPAAAKMATPRRTIAMTYEDNHKIALVPDARAYRTGGNVEKAVELMKRHPTVKGYVDAMAKSDNPLPAIGLLRFLHKKGCVTINGQGAKAAPAKPTPAPAPAKTPVKIPAKASAKASATT